MGIKRGIYTPGSATYATISGTPSNPVTSASATRPTGLTVVWWVCSTRPTNIVAGDIWISNA